MKRIFAAVATLCLATAPALATDHPEREFKECPDCPDMVAIPAGGFVMGSPAREPGRFDSEGPQHHVSIKAFARSRTLWPLVDEG